MPATTRASRHATSPRAGSATRCTDGGSPLVRVVARAIADHLALAPLTAPRTHQILLAAAPVAGLTAVKVGAAWRAASGFAHGRYWPNLRASQPRAARPGADGVRTVALVIDEDQHRPLAEYSRIMLRQLQERYHARTQAR